MKLKFFLIIFLIFVNCAHSSLDEYYQNLKNIKKIQEDSTKVLPIIYNQLCQSGYFTMPSAKMADTGNLAFQYSFSDPYKIIGVNLQYFDRLEITANFWIYKNILESNFGHLGFGEDADRAANIKFAILHKADGFKYFPQIAVGINDFIGSKRFNSKYIVATKEFLDLNFELTLGYSIGRIDGFFAAGSFFYFLPKNKFFQSLAIFAEYDANNYKHNLHEHPKGKKVNYPVNLGLNFQICNLINASISSIRGDKIGANLNLNYNLGESGGLYPKIYDTNIYKEYSYLKDECPISNLVKAFKDQGIDLVKISYFYDKNCRKVYTLKICNLKYRSKEILRLRIQNILSYFSKNEYSSILVTVESDGLELHQYLFKNEYLQDFKDNKISSCELEALCPIQDICTKSKDHISKTLYQRKNQLWIMTFLPKMNAFFGSCKGKFKYDAGFTLTQEGYFLNQIYYNLQTSYIIKTASAQIGSRDVYNPSSIINVRSDFTKYYESNSFHVDNFYLQKNFNLNKAFFCKLALGYFEVAYGGIDFELLYYPVNSNLACSIEAANVYKRKYSGLGFEKKVRKWKNNLPVYEHFIGYEYFLNLFYELKPLHLTVKTQFGGFLAKDKGIKLEFIKYFKSGFEVDTWITFTNKYDSVNGKRYFDKGFCLSIPLDIFMNKSSRKRFCFKMSEWERDVGASAKTGRELYKIIHDERYFP